MQPRKKARPIYTDDYYRMEKLVNDPIFKKKVKGLRVVYEKAGCPLPSKGFEKYREYMDWLNVFWDAFTKIERGALAQEIKRIQEDPAVSEDKKYWKIMNAHDQLLPPTPGKFLEDCVREGGLDYKNRKYKDFLELHVFLGRLHLSEPLFNIRWIRNQKTEKMELFIQLLPHTKKEHIETFWTEVSKEVERLPGYLGKNKPWDTFERDLEIYHTYQQVKDERPKDQKRASPTWPQEGGPMPLDYETLMRVCEKHKGLTLSAVRKAVTRIAELDLPNEDV